MAFVKDASTMGAARFKAHSCPQSQPARVPLASTTLAYAHPSRRTAFRKALEQKTNYFGFFSSTTLASVNKSLTHLFSE